MEFYLARHRLPAFVLREYYYRVDDQAVTSTQATALNKVITRCPGLQYSKTQAVTLYF